MDMRFDDKLTETVNDLREDLNLETNGEVVRRAIALLKVVTAGALRGERLYLIDVDTRKEILL